MKQTFFFSMFVVLLILAGCATSGQKPVSANLPPNRATAPPQEYMIQSGDQLDIKFFYNPELNELVTVRPDGRISLQLIKEMTVTGLTPVQLNEHLSEKYAPLIRKPEIAIIVRTFSAQKVFVDGEVNRAGLVALTDQMTVMQAISQAGGFKDTARSDEVVIIRKGADNAFAATPVNLKSVQDGSDSTQNLTLRQNDVVFVPKSGIANVNLFIDQYIRKNIPIPVGFGFGID